MASPVSRVIIPQSTQTKLLVMSRRRCCICFGLDRDANLKKGQIAHLDHDSSNADFENLAYLCLEHHDEYDGRTSQSKALTVDEVKKYRTELYEHFSGWANSTTTGHLLNYLASQVSNEDIAQSVVDVASRMYFYGPRHAHDVLTMPELRSFDAETILAHLAVLDSCASWGLLTYEEEDILEDGVYDHTLVTVHHRPTCAKLASIIEKWIQEKGEVNWK